MLTFVCGSVSLGSALGLRLPVECVWIGPLLTNYDCSSCILGYETTSPDDVTCVKPNFRPHKHWEGSVERSQLKLQGTGGAPVQIDPDTNTANLFTGHTYTIPAPQLEPKERMFAGYKQPHTKIHYELDFLLGAEADIGCGTAVVGNGALDGTVSKKHATHPLSMDTLQFQWMWGRGNLNAGDPGSYPQRLVAQPPSLKRENTCPPCSKAQCSLFFGAPFLC